jgi:NADPH2:quinone reductase
MKAVRFDRLGPPEVLEVVDVAIPAPGAGEVLVRVAAAGINFFEVLMRADRYAVTPDLPMIPGVEAAGIVEVLGEGADRSLLGARVAVPLFAFGGGGSGGYAEFVAADSTSVIRLPDAVGFEDAVASMVQGLTALHLIRCSPPQGKTVLINAAAGGVGSVLVQLARHEGAKSVIAAAGSEEKRMLALSLGADLAVDYTAPGWPSLLKTQTGGGADLIYETVGVDVTRASLDALACGGELVFAALGRFQLDAGDLNRMFERNQSIRGFALLPLLSRETLASDLSMLFDLVAAGSLKITIGGRFPLHDAAAAHRAIERRIVSGKVVLMP